jgi:azurin
MLRVCVDTAAKAAACEKHAVTILSDDTLRFAQNVFSMAQSF